MNKMLSALAVLGVSMNPLVALSEINCQPGENLVVSAPHSVTRVEMNGVNILDDNNQVDLRNSFLPPLSEIEYSGIMSRVMSSWRSRGTTMSYRPSHQALNKTSWVAG